VSWCLCGKEKVGKWWWNQGGKINKIHKKLKKLIIFVFFVVKYNR
jgi:hypothetical protein